MRVRIVTTIIPGIWNKPREMTGTLVSQSDSEVVLSFRPKAGTSTIERKHIFGMWETQGEISLPHIFRGETRLQ